MRKARFGRTSPYATELARSFALAANDSLPVEPGSMPDAYIRPSLKGWWRSIPVIHKKLSNGDFVLKTVVLQPGLISNNLQLMAKEVLN